MENIHLPCPLIFFLNSQGMLLIEGILENRAMKYKRAQYFSFLELNS